MLVCSLCGGSRPLSGLSGLPYQRGLCDPCWDALERRAVEASPVGDPEKLDCTRALVADVARQLFSSFKIGAPHVVEVTAQGGTQRAMCACSLERGKWTCIREAGHQGLCETIISGKTVRFEVGT